MHPARRRAATHLGALLFFVLMAASMAVVSGAELDQARKHFLNGNYSECIRVSQQAVDDNEYDEEWRLLLMRSLLATGQYPRAKAALSNSLDRYTSSIRVRLIGFDVLRSNGDRERAQSMLADINYLAGSRTWAYRDAANMVALGRAAVLLGADPKKVLETFFEAVKKADPENRETYLASGDLALTKHDYRLASVSFQEGLKKHPKDADLWFGLAEAFSPSDRGQMLKAIDSALNANTNHVPSMLLLVDHMIDAEEYDGAMDTLDRIARINPNHPEAWAYRAVIEHLANNAKGEVRSRERALAFWATNPEVDHIIGRKLSQKYRFAEGSAYQFQALRFDPGYLPAKIQLSQDLLRLGKETDGWKLAEEVHKDDAYDVTAYNLVTLHESLSKFRTLTNQHFTVRMAANEADIYGQRVLGLLDRARQQLCSKYGMELERMIFVEIFPNPRDFGVRTFGIPDNPGYLGVCFGCVITANSPASRGGNPSNWEAVLWHEFCHVVTLELTRNKMPRWLSEGISVHEELQANPTWGQSMNPRYREMILNDELAPISEMSGAFLTPKSSFHLQFAYYQSALVVEFLVKQFGMEKLTRILRDLREGIPINEAIETHTEPMKKLETDFAAFAKKRAEDLAPGLDWEKPTREDGLLTRTFGEGFQAGKNPKNYYYLIQQSRQLMEQKKWQEAKEPLTKLLKEYPGQTGGDGAYAMLAAAHRALKETESEREVLMKWASVDSEALDAYVRLMELEADRKNWAAVRLNAERFLAVNPLLSQPYAYLARASEALGKAPDAIDTYRLLLRLEPPDPADVHYRIAKLMKTTGHPDARRHALQALEEAPRFRDAHRLLLELPATPPKVHGEPPKPTSDVKPNPAF